MAWFRGYDDDYPRYVTVEERRRAAERQLARLRRLGHDLQPVVTVARRLVQSWWGRAWCDNLIRYSDFANRMPRGRSYVRAGAVIDLKVEPGRVRAQVMGTRLYQVSVAVAPIPEERWRRVVEECAGQLTSLVEIMRGQMPRSILDALTRQGTGLFPAPSEIELTCSCPDWAQMCKHVAAALYGIGVRLDGDPELFFTLRRLDATDLLQGAGQALSAPASTTAVLAPSQLSALFGIELDGDPAPLEQPAGKRPSRRKGAGGGTARATPRAGKRRPQRRRGRRPPPP
jgi:uncharacterized Zn finger protein